MVPSLDLVLKLIGFGVAVPAAVALAGLMLARWWGKRHGGVAPRGGDGLAAGAGLLAGFIALAGSGQLGWEILKPTDSWHWLPLLTILATAAGIVERVAPVPMAARWVLRLVIAALTAGLLVRAEIALGPVHPGWYAGLGGAVLAVWGLLDPVARRWPGALLPALLALVALAAAAVLELAGILRFAQMAGVLMAVLAACAIVAPWYPGESPVRGFVPGTAVLLTGLLFAGYFNTFSEVPLASFLLVLAAPVGLGVSALLLMPKLPRLWARAVPAGVTLALLGIALALAARA